MKILKMKLIFFSLVFLALCTTCGGGGGGDIIPPFTTNDAVATGDLNGDGKPDLALVTTYVAGPPPHPGHVAVYLQDPANPGTFLSAVNYNVGSDPWHIAIADLNSDGKLDLVVANTNSNDVSVLLHDTSGLGSFHTAVNYASGSYTNFVAVGDLNGDGRPDITAAINEGVCILFQNPANPGAFLPAIRLPLPSRISSVAIGDLNGDGRADLVATSSDNIYVFIQDPTSPGTFLSAVTYVAGPRASSVVISDIDGDGTSDLVIVNAGDSSSGGNSSISIRLQDQASPGRFLTARNYASANGSRSVTAGDLNGDGRPDLAVAAVVYSSQSPGVVQAFIQDITSPGTFLLPQSYRAGYTPQSIASGDFNGDGKPDLVSNDGPIILIQNPAQPGKFAEGIIIPVH
jgi:hypothetical protein